MAIRAGAFASLSVMTLLLVAPLSCMAGNLLYSVGTLQSWEFLKNGQYYLIMEPLFCDLVVYDEINQNFTWASNPPTLRSNCMATLYNNGSLMVSDQGGAIVWENGVNSEEGKYVLILEKDGNVGIYGPKRWDTNTTNTASTTNVCKPSRAFMNNWKARMMNTLPAAN